MRCLKIRFKSSERRQLELFLISVAVALSLVSLVISDKASDLLPASFRLLLSIFGIVLLTSSLLVTYLFSRFSPIKRLRIRKKLMLFTEQLTKQVSDGELLHSIEWKYDVSGEKITIQLFSVGLVPDKKRLANQLSEFLKENLMEFKELDGFVQLTFGSFPERYEGLEVLCDDQL